MLRHPLITVIALALCVRLLPATPGQAADLVVNAARQDTPAKPDGIALATPDAPSPAILRLTLSSIQKGEAPVLIRGTDILMRPSDLVDAGLLAVPGRIETHDGVPYVSLRSMAPLLTYRFDEDTLALSLSADPSLLPLAAMTISSPRPAGIVYPDTPSLFVNYAVDTADFHAPSVFVETGASLLGRLTFHGTGSYTPTAGLTRGLTALALDDRPNLVRWTLGDATLFTSALGGGALFGGLSVAKEYGLDPYFTRTPDFTIRGAVETPSTAELYGNGTLLSRIDLQPGRFSLNRLPLPPGERAIRLIVRDAFGREREVTQSVYFTPTLLAEGLQEWRYGLGARRIDLGVTSFGYDTPLFLGLHRIGLTDDLTAGWRVEASERLVSGGPLLAMRSHYGEIGAEAAFSADRGRAGWAGLFSYGYTAGRFSLGASLTRKSARYAIVDIPADAERALWRTSAFAGLQATDRLSLTAQYRRDWFRDNGESDRLSGTAQLRLLPAVSLLLTAGRTTSSNRPDTYDVGLSLTFALGRNATASGSSTSDLHRGATTFTYRRHLPQGDGFGYQASATIGDQVNAAVTGQYQGPYGRYEAAYARFAEEEHVALRLAGAVAAVGGAIAASRPIEGAFAIVETPDVPGVRTYVNRAELGRTNAQGSLVLPTLQPYLANNIAVADQDFPPDRQADTFWQLIAPPRHGGALVRFTSHPFKAVRGHVALREPDGERLIAGGLVTLAIQGQTFESPIGYQGEFYLENLPPGRYGAAVQHAAGRCQADIVVPATDQLVTDIGRAVCMPIEEPTR